MFQTSHPIWDFICLTLKFKINFIHSNTAEMDVIIREAVEATTSAISFDLLPKRDKVVCLSVIDKHVSHSKGEHVVQFH